MKKLITLLVGLLSIFGVKAQLIHRPITAADRTQSFSHPAWVDNAVIYEANLRQGTSERSIKGLQKQLPRLKNLGVDIIWLMPVHPISVEGRKGELGSYYAVADYKAVNPEFGSLADIKEFVDQAHKLGMRVILDEVCNHSGCDNPWVKSNPEFYARNAEGKMFGPYDWTDVYKFDYSNTEMREAMLDALRFWVKEIGIDGYRADVAMEVPTDFWNEARRQLSEIKPVFMLAEASKPELTFGAFDADYNWPMKDVFNAIAATQGVNKFAKEHNQSLPKSDAKTIVDLVKKQESAYPRGAFSMNMVTNHDLNSWEGTEFDRLGPALGAFAVLSYTLPGMPMLYSGQEVGFDHAWKFFEQDITPDYAANDFTAFYTMLNALKHRQKALANGARNFEPLAVDGSDVIAFTRTSPDGDVTVLANLSNAEKPLKFKKGSAPNVAGKRDWFTGLTLQALPATLAPWQYIILTDY